MIYEQRNKCQNDIRSSSRSIQQKSDSADNLYTVLHPTGILEHFKRAP